VKIKWVVSFISCTDDMRQTIRGLGLRRMHQVSSARIRRKPAHDPQGASPRGSGGIEQWQRKLQAAREGPASAVSTSRRHRREARRTFALSNLQPPAGSRHRKVRVGRGIGSKLGKTSGSGNKGRSLAAGIRAAAVLKADRCHCTGACRNAAFIIRSA